MKKCIIWGRVSTVYQDMDEQVNKLVEKAKKDGYQEDNIIILAKKGVWMAKEGIIWCL